MERIGEGCRETSFKFVGHYLDEKLKWDYHIQHVRSKLAKSNYAITRSKNILPENIRTTLYHSLFRPHLEYGIINWGGTQSSRLTCLVNLQKKCIRSVAGKGARAHTEPIFRRLGLLRLNDLYRFKLLTFMHKYYYSKQPDAFLNFFKPCPAGEILLTRQANFKIDRSRNNTLENLPSVRLPLAWNDLTSESKQTTSFPKFKQLIIEGIMKSYAS